MIEKRYIVIEAYEYSDFETNILSHKTQTEIRIVRDNEEDLK